MPGRLVFYTTPDGGTSAAERMVIKNDGNVGINSTAPSALLDVNGTAKIGEYGQLEVNNTGQVLSLIHIPSPRDAHESRMPSSA